MAKPAKVVILGDSKDAERAFKKIREEAGKTQSKLAKVGQKMGSVGKGMTKGLTLPILGVGVALLGAAKRTGELADRILDLEAITGVSTDKIQEMQFVARQAGVSSEFYTKAITQVTKAQDQLTAGTGPVVDAFDSLGIAIETSDGSMRSSEELTDEAMKALQAIEDPTKRAALAQDIFGRSFEDLLPVLAMSSDQMAAATKEARDIGAIMSGDALNDANEFRQGMETLQASVGGLVSSIGAGLAPLLTQISTLLTDHVVPAVRGIVEGFQNLPGPVKKTIGVMVGVLAVLGPMLIVGGKVATMFAADGNLVKGFGHVKKGFIALKKTLMANPWILLIAAVIALVVIIVKNWDTIVGFLTKVWDGIKQAASAVGTWLKDKFREAVEFIKTLFFNFTPLGILISKFDKIKEKVTEVKEWFIDKFEEAIDWFGGFGSKITDATSGMWDGIKTAFKSAINWIIRKWNNFKIELGGQRVDLPFGASFTIPKFTLRTPHIDTFHTGGVFRAPTRGGEGLAILKDRERVLPADTAAGRSAPLIGVVNLMSVPDPNEIARAIAWRLRTVGI